MSIDAIDIREINVLYFPDVADNSDPEDNYVSKKQQIFAKYKGSTVGRIDFYYVEQVNYMTDEEEKIIYLAYIEVDPEYRGLGISGMMYKKFGEVYGQRFMNLPVERHFENPIAEYSFKKAIDEGWVPSQAYTPERTTRNYDGDKADQWNDLKQKLPENLQASRFSRLKKLALNDQEKLDLRNGIQFEIVGPGPERDWGECTAQKYTIKATYDGDDVGSLDFSHYVPKEEFKNDPRIYEYIYVTFIYVSMSYEGAGVGQLLYKQFGDFYQQNFNGLPVGRHFVNPVAEYSFRKAVSLGWVPEIALTEDEISRDYVTERSKNLWKDLRQKLPEHLRGPEASLRKDMRKFASSVDVNPIDIEQREISNRGRKIEVFRDGEMLGDMKYEIYPEHEYIYINYVDVQEQYRQNGVAMLLYKTFSEVYNSQYQGWRIGRVFVNPVAEYAYTKAVAMGWFPESTLNNIKRDYTPENQEKWYNELEPKVRDFRNKNKKAV